MNYPNVIEERVKIGDISAIVFRPTGRQEKLPGVVFYHGWSSNKDSQRFRSYILSSLGYVVLLPDSIYHGERGLIDYSKKENGPMFWEVVLNNLKEWSNIKDFLISKYKIDKDRIAVSGHSMGGFTSAGIFAQDKGIKALIVHNGSCNWRGSNDIFIKTLGFSENDNFSELEVNIHGNDPMGKTESLVDRAILILHGDNDQVVSIEPQIEFYNKLIELNNNNDSLKMITYSGLNHYLTTGMLEEMTYWLEKHLKE